MQQTIEDLVRSEEHVLNIILPENQHDYIIDYTKFLPAQKTEVERIIKILTNYLKLPSIIDDFKDHDQRRVWRDEMREKHGKDFRAYYDKNNLRMNCISAISINLEYFFCKKQPYLGQNQETFYEKTETIINNCHPQGGYGTKTTQEKLQMVDKIKQGIRELLDFLSIKNQTI